MDTFASMKTGAGLMPRRSLVAGAKMNIAKPSNCRSARRVALRCQAVVAGDRPETAVAEKVSLWQVLPLQLPTFLNSILFTQHLEVTFIELLFVRNAHCPIFSRIIPFQTSYSPMEQPHCKHLPLTKLIPPLKPKQKLGSSSSALAGQQ
jgi:hypothetical protein